MIHIEQDQTIKADSKIRVAVPTGDYNETDLIECYTEGEDPNTPTCMYQAQFVAFGGPVYEQSEELTEDQLNALIANTPVREVINNRKLIDGKKPASKFVGRVIKRKGKLDIKKLRNDIVDETATTTKKNVFKDKILNEVPVTNQNTVVDSSTSTTTSPVYNNETVATSTSPVYNNETTSTSTSTTTAPVYTESVTSTSTVPVYNAATSTPDTLSATSTATSSEAGNTMDPISETPDSTATSTNPFTSVEDAIGEISTSTEAVEPNNAPVVEAPTEEVSAPVVPKTSDETSTTTDQIVAFAKRKIAKKLGL